MTDVAANNLLDLLARYYSRGVLVDTNILLLYFVGAFERRLIPQFKRTAQFTVEDFVILESLLLSFSQIVTTPNILTEVSNLSGQLGEPRRRQYFKHLSQKIGVLYGDSRLTEKYTTSADIVRLDHFPRLGLTDSGIIQLAKGAYLVLTDDLMLYSFLSQAGVDVCNFNHLRVL
jgi:hypothetical protein